MNDSETSSLEKIIYFTSLKNSSFDFSLPIKKNLQKFTNELRPEASPNLFEYLCYKIAQKKISEKKVLNPEISIISEKYLSSDIEDKMNSIKKKYVFIPIRNSISRKWNAVIFIHLEKQITQYMKQINEEPIIAKIISSNINSEEDDYILNTTMDRIESTFNFSSPEDIQFEVDSINISDQPNTSVFLINFIEGLLEQDNDENIMNYIMKLYDETSNTNAIGSNNYFMSFNKENELFKDILQIYEKDLDEYIKLKGDNDDIKLLKMEEDDIDSEEEALKIIAKENEQIRKQMEEQERIFNIKMNDINLNSDDINYKNKNFLGQIQEADNESEDESDKKSNINSLKVSKSLKKKYSDNNIYNDEKVKNMVKEKLIETNKEFIKEVDYIKNNNESQNINDNSNNCNIKDNSEKKESKEKHFNKEESIELTNIEQNKEIKKEENKEDIQKKDSNEEDYEIKEENIVIKNSVISNSDNNIQNSNISNISNNYKINDNIKNNEKEINNDIKINDINIIEKKTEVNVDDIIDNQIESNTNKETDNQTLNKTEINNNDNNLLEQLSIPKFQNKTIEITSADINIKNNNIKDIHNQIRDSSSSNNSSVYEKKKISQKRNSFNKNNNSNNPNNINNAMNTNLLEGDNSKVYNNTNFYISKANKENTNTKNIMINRNENKIINNNLIEKNNNKIINNITDEKNKNIIFNKKKGIGKYKTNLPLVNKNQKTNNITNNIPKDKYEKNTNTIIINELSNNKTVINIIGIKNDYKEEEAKTQNKELNKINNDMKNQNQIFNINISNHNKINLINNEKEATEYITKIPDDGTINPISSTFCVNNTIADINNINNNINDKSFKNISYIKNKENIDNNNMKETLKENNNINPINTDEKNNESDNEGNIKQNNIRIDDENNIDVNLILSNNYKNRIQRMTTRKRNNRNINGNHGFFKEIEANDCTLDFTKDMKCGCSGGAMTGCNIF